MVMKTLAIYQELISTLITQNNQNFQNTGHVSQTEEGVSVYKTYPITELKMHLLIHWHLCLYRGVKLWSFCYLLLSVKLIISPVS